MSWHSSPKAFYRHRTGAYGNNTSNENTYRGHNTVPAALNKIIIVKVNSAVCGLSGLTHRSAAVEFLELWVRIPLRAWMFVACFIVSVLATAPGGELISRSEEPCRVCARVFVRACTRACVCQTSTRWPGLSWAAERTVSG